MNHLRGRNHLRLFIGRTDEFCIIAGDYGRNHCVDSCSYEAVDSNLFKVQFALSTAMHS